MKTSTLVFFICTVFFASASFVMAQAPINAGPTQQPQQPINAGPTLNPKSSNQNTTLINPLGSSGTSLESFLYAILDFMIRIGTIAIVITMVFIGFKYVTVARSNPGKISEVHTMLLWTVVGALILLGAKAIAMGIGATISALSGGS